MKHKSTYARRMVKTHIFLSLIALFLFVPLVDAAHTFDTSAHYQTTSWSTANPATLSFTAGPGASVMVLTIFTAGSSYRTAGTPTFNGKSFTSLGRNMYTSSPEGSSEMWYLLLTPADTGSTYTVSVPNAPTKQPISFHVSTFKSATGVSALDVNASKNALGTNPSQSITTTANGDVIVSGMFTGLQTVPTVTSPGTQIYSSAATNYKGMSQYYIQSSFGTQALGWTSGTSDDYSMQTAAFQEMPPNPVPITSSISPNSKNAGDAQFTMTVTGTNFVSGSVVRFDGANRTTTYGSATSLSAIIPATDLTSAGTHSITVFNPAPGGGTSNAQAFTVNNPVPTTSSISPNSKNAGDAQFTMTVTGTNFVSGSIVRFDGANRTTTYGSATSLSAIIPATDLTSAGTHSITVFNPAPGGGTSTPDLTFTVVAAHTFDTSATYQTTSWNIANPGNISYTAGAGATLMILSIQTSAALRTAGTPTFHGKNFINLGRNIYTSSPEGASELWYLLLDASDTGSAYTVSVPNAATSRAMTYQVSTYKSATGVSALDLNTSGTGLSANPSQTLISTANGDLYVSALFGGNNNCPSARSGTLLFCNDDGQYTGGSQYFIQTLAGSNTMSFTLGSDDWAMQTAAFKEVTPIPAISSISPDTRTVGDAQFDMTVTGTNFISNSKVLFNGTNRTTIYVSATQLTAIIPASDLMTAGTSTITVINFAPGSGVTSNAQTFTVNSPTYTFSNSSSPMVGISVTETVNSTSSSGAYMDFTWIRSNGTTRRTSENIPRVIDYVDTASVDLEGSWTIDVIEKNSSYVQLGTGSTSFNVIPFPEFGKLGAVLPLFAVGFVYISLRGKKIKK